jgi:outer membrane receptor protein involved in Fe transport
MRFVPTRSGPVLWIATAALLVLSSMAMAGNGKLAGKVTDASGQPLIGANVVTTVGTTPRGTTTDDEGKYFILNVPPGVYTVTASYIGYKSLAQTEVSVRLDLTSAIDFAMERQTIAGQVVTIVAEAPMVEKSRTSSRASISAAELNNSMPVSDLSELVETTPSVFKGYIRGGRKADSRILVDGIDVSDTYFRGGEGRSATVGYAIANRSSANEYTAVGINSSAVQSLDIISGTFNAEYDAASAGIINVTTREGGDETEARLFFRFSPSGIKNAGADVYNDLDDYLAERAELSASDDAGDNAEAANYTFDNQTIDKIGYGDDLPYEAELSIGGPISDKTHYYGTARFVEDSGQFSYEQHRSARYSLKLTHQQSDAIKLTASGWVDDGGILGGFTNRDFTGVYKFFPEGNVGNKKLGAMGYLAMTHTLSENTFYELKVSQLNRESQFGYSDDDADGRPEIGEDGDFIRIDTPEEAALYLGTESGVGARPDGGAPFFSTLIQDQSYSLNFSNTSYRFKKAAFYYNKLERNVTQAKFDLTSQVNYNHQLKGGLMLRRHEVNSFEQLTTVPIGYDEAFPFQQTDFSVNPKEYSAYLQDRIEYEGVIINAGMRLDGFDVAVDQFSDFFNPFTIDTLSTGQIARTEVRDRDIDVKWFWQPRVGISHPVSENSAMYYSWGKFYSAPSFSTIYENYGTFAQESLPSTPDVARNPSQATAYEMGLQYSFHPEYLLDVAAYYRDIDNFGSQGYSVNPVTGGSYTLVTSGGYADSRGLELGLERRASGRVNWRLNYALSYIKASGGAGDTSPFPDRTSFAASQGDKDIPFEKGETFNTIERNVAGGQNPLTQGFDRTNRLALTLMADLPMDIASSLISTYESGFLYRVTATATDPRDIESKRAPFNMTVDLRLTRGFNYGDQRIGAFLEVRNLLDRENIVAFNGGSDVASQTLWETDEDPTGTLGRAFNANGLAIYGPARRVNLGFSLDF